MNTADIFKLILWEAVNPFLLKIKRNKKIKYSSDIRGINLGCGFDNPENWLGIDGGASLILIQNCPKFILRRYYENFNTASAMDFEDYIARVRSLKFIHRDIRYGLPFSSDSIPNIFSSHFLEHLHKGDALKLLNECYRVMKKNGCIRIVVPSLDAAVESIDNALSEYRSGNIEPIQKHVTNLQIGFMDSFTGHKWMYNFNELQQLLREAGFSQVSECEYKKGNIPDVEVLDTRTGLTVEAVK